MTNPNIVFCTTCKGRVAHIEKTLPRNLADNPNSKFVLLDYNSPDHLQSYLFENHDSEITSGRLVVYDFPTHGPFKMAHAKNMAHRLAILEGADILVNLDADNFTGPDFAEYIAEQFAKDPNGYLFAQMIREGENKTPRGILGRIVVSKHAFLNAGGYDEKYETWGPDDKDFNARLHRLGYIGSEIDPRYLSAVPHNDKMRFKEYKHVATDQGEEAFQVDQETTVANFGNVGQGVVFRNFGRDPIELGPVPTRIFGIGMHKTATTSLHHALQILGFDSAHWKGAHWAKKIWREMNGQDRSLTLEKHYALSDFPIAPLYQKLDLAYPGSKFILTVRNENSWLRSVAHHWDPERNPYRAGWDSDPFTHRMHRAVYGQREFDSAVMLERYRRHNAEVLEYFKNRRGDLLVMNMEHDGWPQLCGFLKRPIPGVDYPTAFATGGKA